MLSLPGKHPVLHVAVALITNSRETNAGTSRSFGGSGNPDREGDVGTGVPAHSSSKVSSSVYNTDKIQIVLITSSLGPFPWLGELGRAWALCAIQSMTALLWLHFCASHKALLCQEYFFFPF